MKKKFLSIIIGATLALQTFSAFAVAEKIVIDNQEVTIPADMGSIKEMDDRTFVPIRFIGEYLGCNVQYNTLTINNVAQESINIVDPNSNRILLVNGSDKLFFFYPGGSGRSVTMDTKTFIDEAEGRTYLPIRFFAEALGYTVGWDEATQTVSLTKAVEEAPADAE